MTLFLTGLIEGRPPQRGYDGVVSLSPADVDLMDPAIQADPYPAYDVLRSQAPVYEMPGTGLFLVTSYAGLDRVIRDPVTFSIQLG